MSNGKEQELKSVKKSFNVTLNMNRTICFSVIGNSKKSGHGEQPEQRLEREHELELKKEKGTQNESIVSTK